jgi:hypothetical protein
VLAPDVKCHTHARACANAHTFSYTYAHAHLHVHTHARTQTRTHTYTHTHTDEEGLLGITAAELTALAATNLPALIVHHGKDKDKIHTAHYARIAQKLLHAPLVIAPCFPASAVTAKFVWKFVHDEAARSVHTPIITSKL